MVSFENVVKSMPPSLSELKVLPIFCFAFKMLDNVTASNMYVLYSIIILGHCCSNQYLESFFRELADAKSFRHSGQNFPRMVDDFVESHVDIVLDPKI